jgi:hypothetical protein
LAGDNQGVLVFSDLLAGEHQLSLAKVGRAAVTPLINLAQLDQHIYIQMKSAWPDE